MVRRFHHPKFLYYWIFVASLICLLVLYTNSSRGSLRISLSPDQGKPVTKEIQAAIDSCSKAGGGEVWFLKGTYLSGSLQLRSNVNLLFEEGAVLIGSSSIKDYSTDAFLFGKDLSGISISGSGTIDGVDCINPDGEEGFRGPHCIRLINCSDIHIENITIKNSGNWAINCRYCTRGVIRKVKIRGGHDGLHTRFCSNFSISGCDFRTGDDAFAGNDNQNFIVKDCLVNTSCNGFRFGCNNLIVQDCRIWGPGEYEHKLQKRNNTLSAFTHFSPEDENPKLESGNWIIQDVRVDNVDQFYNYNLENGLWQTGQAVTDIHFKNIEANNLLRAFTIIGDTQRKFTLHLSKSSFRCREEPTKIPKVFEGAIIESPAFFSARNFNSIELMDVSIEKKTDTVLLDCKYGNSIILNNTELITGNEKISYSFSAIDEIFIDNQMLKCY